MTKIQMPEPVAWLHEDLDHVITTSDKNAAKSTFARYKHALITTNQAEAYADAMVKEALETAAQEVELTHSNSDDQDRFQIRAAGAIRALIPEGGTLLPCPFCGGDAHFKRVGTPRQSCIVACGECGVRLETGEEGSECGGSWNRRTALIRKENKHDNQE